MAPDKLLNDPTIAPFMMGMVVKIKDWAVMKGFFAVVIFSITTSSAVTVFYTQTNAMMKRQDEYILKVDSLTEKVMTLQSSINITNNNVANFVKNLTAKVDEMRSDIAKLRR